MDYQLTQTGPEVQGILNQAPEVVSVGDLNTIDAVGNYYVTDGDGKARGYLICSQSGPAGSPFYLQTYLHDGAVSSRSGNALPLTGEWVNGMGGVTVLSIRESVDAAAVYADIHAGKQIVLDYDGTYLPLSSYIPGQRNGTPIADMLEFVDSYFDPTDGVESVTYFAWRDSEGWEAGETALATTDQVRAKQDVIDDLSTIRSGAAAGATAYQKPSAGIPKTDLASAVQTSLGKADTSVQPAALTPIQNAIDGIEAVIPSEASAQNQLADKNYVDTHSSDVDDALSTTSENPVQNKVVTNALNETVKNKGSNGNVRVGVGNDSNIDITSSGISMETPNGALAIGNNVTINTSGEFKYNGNRVATTTDLQGKQDVIRDLQAIRDGAAAGATAVQPAALQEGLAGKQDTISDLSTIRSGAAAGATAYQKPSTGIPKTDLASAVQTSLGKADTSVQPAALTPIQNAIDGIEAVIPSEASAQNQLADKNYVDTHSSDVDDALSTTSENPVQNKVVTNALNGKQATISDLSAIRSGAAAGATAVQPAAMNTALAAKQDAISTVNVTVDNNTGTPSGSASVSGGTLSLSFQNLKGATGEQGPQGIQGVQGVQGPKGDTGVTGDASSLAIIHGIDKTSSYGATDVCGADAAQALLNEIEGGFYY